MNSCLPESDLQQLGQTLISDFRQRVAHIPKDLCAPFHKEAAQLETELMMIYKFVVLCVRQEEDLALVSKKWGMFVAICDEAAKKLSELSNHHPSCGAETYYDNILDLRAKCQRLQTIHA